MVTFLIFLDTLFPIFTEKLRQLTRNSTFITILFVTVISAVIVAITHFFAWYPQTANLILQVCKGFAFMITILFLSVITVALIPLIMTVIGLITSKVWRNTVGEGKGCIPWRISTSECSKHAIWRHLWW